MSDRQGDSWRSFPVPIDRDQAKPFKFLKAAELRPSLYTSPSRHSSR